MHFIKFWTSSLFDFMLEKATRSFMSAFLFSSSFENSRLDTVSNIYFVIDFRTSLLLFLDVSAFFFFRSGDLLGGTSRFCVLVPPM